MGGIRLVVESILTDEIYIQKVLYKENLELPRHITKS